MMSLCYAIWSSHTKYHIVHLSTFLRYAMNNGWELKSKNLRFVIYRHHPILLNSAAGYLIHKNVFILSQYFIYIYWLRFLIELSDILIRNIERILCLCFHLRFMMKTESIWWIFFLEEILVSYGVAGQSCSTIGGIGIQSILSKKKIEFRHSLFEMCCSFKTRSRHLSSLIMS